MNQKHKNHKNHKNHKQLIAFAEDSSKSVWQWIEYDWNIVDPSLLITDNDGYFAVGDKPNSPPRLNRHLAGKVFQESISSSSSPMLGTPYWIAQATGKPRMVVWKNEAEDYDALAYRLVHDDEQSARDHSIALWAANLLAQDAGHGLGQD